MFLPLCLMLCDKGLEFVCVCVRSCACVRVCLCAALTEFFTAALPSATASNEPLCVAASSPGVSSPSAAGPAGPALPVT